MIDIIRYREILAELKERINASGETMINEVVIAVKEGHMQKKLKDKSGLLLCANFPDADLQGAGDCYKENNQVLFFILEKVASGSEDDETEIQHYAQMQRVMSLLKRELLDKKIACGELDVSEGMSTEWEYDIFGGFNGLSLGVKIVDYD